jgi:hemoglobin
VSSKYTLPDDELDNLGIGLADDVGVSPDPLLRFQLVAWFTWATAMLNHRWSEPDDVPGDLPFPIWNWDGTEGW